MTNNSPFNTRHRFHQRIVRNANTAISKQSFLCNTFYYCFVTVHRNHDSHSQFNGDSSLLRHMTSPPHGTASALFNSLYFLDKNSVSRQWLSFNTSPHSSVSGTQFPWCLVVSMRWHSLSSEWHTPRSSLHDLVPWSASPHLTVSHCLPVQLPPCWHTPRPHTWLAGWLTD